MQNEIIKPTSLELPMSKAPRKSFYVVEAYRESDPRSLAHARTCSRKQASTVFGNLRTRFPGATVTLNRKVPTPGTVAPGETRTWKTTTHRHIDGSLRTAR